MNRVVDSDVAPTSLRMTDERPVTPGLHRPVLVEAALAHLAPKPGMRVVDATAGMGGHSLALLPKLLPDGSLIAIDRDTQALDLARRRLVEFSERIEFVHGNFRDLPDILENLGVAKIDALLLDLGMSSFQVDSAGRGFSFLKDGPLDMRMDATQDFSARELVNTWRPEDLLNLLWKLGEERFASSIVRRVVEARRRRPIETTAELASIIAAAVPPKARYGRLHPATRTFQAIRMAVNDELGAIEQILESFRPCMNPGARAVVITFHSLEDRLVKHAFRAGALQGFWKVLTKKPVTPEDEEIQNNARARSAKLRAIEILAEPSENMN